MVNGKKTNNPKYRQNELQSSFAIKTWENIDIWYKSKFENFITTDSEIGERIGLLKIILFVGWGRQYFSEHLR